jgi:hypothetical protein
MTSKRPPPKERNTERGAIALLVAALWISLFGFAALAVDAGYLYQSQRGIQAVADAAVMAGLPSLQTSQSTAQTNATKLLSANGYTTGITVTPSSTQLTVNIQVTQPRFFGGILGFNSKQLSVTSVGQINPAGAAMYAINTSCTGVGIRIDGGTANITGPIESNGVMDYATGPNAITSSTSTYSPSCSLTQNNGVTGSAPAAGAVGPDPFGYTLADFPVANCAFGTNFSNATPLNTSLLVGFWQGTTGTSNLNPGIVCSGSDIQFSGSSITGTVSFVAAGIVNLSGTDIHLTAAPGAHGLVVYSDSPAGDDNISGYCAFPEAISIGSSTWTLAGSLYAPHGCISIGGTGVSVAGSLIGGDVNIHGDITVNSGAGGAGGGYYLYK